jgi:hypothetical protein
LLQIHVSYYKPEHMYQKSRLELEKYSLGVQIFYWSIYNSFSVMQNGGLLLQILIKNRFYVASTLPRFFCFQNDISRLTASKQCMCDMTDRNKEFLNRESSVTWICLNDGSWVIYETSCSNTWSGWMPVWFSGISN